MTNPFDGPMANPWVRDETQVFYRALARSGLETGEIERLFKSAGGDGGDLTKPAPASDLWRQVIDLLAIMGGALLALCNRLCEDHDDLKEVRIAAQAILSARPAVEKRVLPGNWVALDRANLRQKLTEMSWEDAPFKVLLVRGEPQSGKTFSRYLFERAAMERGALATFMDRDMVGSVDEVIKKLFGIYNARHRIPDGEDQSTDAWYRAVCTELTLVASNAVSPRQLWIAVDDLGFQPDGVTPLMDPEIRNFFNQFVMLLSDPLAYPWFRLMLIHYPITEPASWKRMGLLDEDRTAVHDVCKDHVVEVIREWLRDRGEQQLDVYIDRTASEVIAYADSPPPENTKPWLELIHEELKRRLTTAQGAKP
jgi:hypothetical protein